MDEKYEHYVVCYYYRNNQFSIGDPARGIIYWNKEELEQYWKTKTCLTLKPNSNFVKAESTNKTKKNGLLAYLRKIRKLFILLLF